MRTGTVALVNSLMSQYYWMREHYYILIAEAFDSMARYADTHTVAECYSAAWEQLQSTPPAHPGHDADKYLVQWFEAHFSPDQLGGVGE